jgi:hypothetical protein
MWYVPGAAVYRERVPRALTPRCTDVDVVKSASQPTQETTSMLSEQDLAVEKGLSLATMPFGQKDSNFHFSFWTKGHHFARSLDKTASFCRFLDNFCLTTQLISKTIQLIFGKRANMFWTKQLILVFENKARSNLNDFSQESAGPAANPVLGRAGRCCTENRQDGQAVGTHRHTS